MQPLPSLPLLPTSVACAALVGLICASASPGAHTGAVHRAAPSPNILAASEDDRGSGRLSDQANRANWTSFRGSGRIKPGPERTSSNVRHDSAPSYRGSGRLG